jgi:hypothetical protein
MRRKVRETRRNIGITETVSRSASAEGWNEPTKNLPPLEVRELPEPVPLGKLIGASVILLVAAWIMCIGGSVIIWSGIQPLWLLVIASSGGGVVMFLYSGMLIWLNRRILPEPIKIKGARLIVVAITFAVFAVLSMYLVYYYVSAALTGQL